MATEDEFHAAAAYVNSLVIDPGNETKLRMYALYKQASEGDIEGKRPGFTNPVGRAKYDAWAEAKGMSAEDAREEYVTLVGTLRT
jgi:acyl-CoA-binding protein